MSLRRRDLLAAGAALALPACRRSRVPENLVPETPCPTPSYWSTWGVQRFGDADPARWARAWNQQVVAADRLTEANLFGPQGWAQAFKPVQADLMLLLDLGWDMAPGTMFDLEPWRLGSLEVSEAKFPSCKGKPADRLQKLVERVGLLGWRGLGVRVAGQVYGDGRGGARASGGEVEEYFRGQLRVAHQAGVGYWKLESGGRTGIRFRETVSVNAKGEAPNLSLENVESWGPLNDRASAGSLAEATGSGQFRTWDQGRMLDTAVEMIGFSRVFRTGEATAQLSIPTTLDRVADLLLRSGGDRGNDCLINCEDEAYMAAALGCTMGVMRHPAWKDPAQRGYDPRLLRYRLTEVVRALRWQRIAPPWPVGYTKTDLDVRRLNDDWQFRPGESAAQPALGVLVRQGAPARVARNAPLPQVLSTGTAPYVVTSRHPNGSTAVATLPRAFAGQGLLYPEVDVTVEVEDPLRPIGVFGRYRSLTLDLVGPPSSVRVMAQDLASNEAVDVTERVNLAGSTMVLPGELINRLGQAQAARNDQSDPGMVLQIFQV
jgi:hypothetical protein